MVYGQNGSGQNGMDKMVYGQNGTDKMLRIKSSINPAPIDTDFFINCASTLTPLAFLYVLTVYLWLLVTKCIRNSTELQCTQNIKLYHFDRTILSILFCPIPFCPIPFCPYTILSGTILSGHHFQSLISALNHTLNLRYACGSPFVIVISIFLQCPPKRSRGNQLIRWFG